MSRFDYVKYDGKAVTDQVILKEQFVKIEEEINIRISDGRAKSIALTKLEEVYMWVGKGIRDDQVDRNGAAALQEERKDG